MDINKNMYACNICQSDKIHLCPEFLLLSIFRIMVANLSVVWFCFPVTHKYSRSFLVGYCQIMCLSKLCYVIVLEHFFDSLWIGLLLFFTVYTFNFVFVAILCALLGFARIIFVTFVQKVSFITFSFAI